MKALSTGNSGVKWEKVVMFKVGDDKLTFMS